MPSTNKTSLGLNQYVGTDEQKRADYNADMLKLDELLRGGVPGIPGPPGPKGDKGDKGDRGDKGDPGTSVNIQPGEYREPGSTKPLPDLPVFSSTAEGNAYIVDDDDVDGQLDLYIHAQGGSTWLVVNNWGGVPGQPGANGAGLPPGGAPGQIPAKKTTADYDTEWVDPPTGGGGDVKSVAGVQPDPNGDVPLAPENISAANAVHSHGVITSDGKAGTAYGRILGTLSGGGISALEPKNALNILGAIGLSNLPITYYVSLSGNDNVGDGSQANPFLTIQKALNSMPIYSNYDRVIILMTGDYTSQGLIDVRGFIGGGVLQIRGQQANSIADAINYKINAVRVTGCNIVWLYGMRANGNLSYSGAFAAVDSKFARVRFCEAFISGAPVVGADGFYSQDSAMEVDTCSAQGYQRSYNVETFGEMLLRNCSSVNPVLGHMRSSAGIIRVAPSLTMTGSAQERIVTTTGLFVLNSGGVIGT